MADWQTYLEQNRERFLNELLDLLTIPSISSLPDHAAAVADAAEWTRNRLRAAGIGNARIMETGGHPIVYGEWLGAPDKPTILIYGHFDTQPVDPEHLWTNPPFQPTLRDGRIYARGASDDKGNMLIPILAVEALLRTEGGLPINVKFFLEGQEEIGSPQLPAFIAEHRELLACDMVVSADSGQWSETEPAIMVAFRGLCAVQIDVKSADSDLHSGIYGGAVPNPIHALVQVLDSLRGADGTIRVEGFYDDVIPLTEEDRSAIAAVPFDEAKFAAGVGARGLNGEPGYTALERLWARPTLEINGIYGGFQGEGVKTVLPNEAHAKITCRLVADQDGSRIIEAITRHVARHAPEGVEVTVTPLPGSSKPYRMSDAHPGNQAAREVLREEYGRDPYSIRVGGSVPVCELFLTHLGAYTVGFGFALDDERFHAPDEFFRVASFERGPRAYCKLLHRLAAA